MNRVPQDRQIQIIKALVEGNSIRSTERLTGTHRDTIMRLLVRVGKKCESFMDRMMQGLDLKNLEVDEIWTFVQKKQRRLTPEESNRRDIGDAFLFFAVDRDTRLAPVWTLGKRDGYTAYEFMTKLKDSLNGTRPQISTDAFRPYAEVIEFIWGANVDYGSIEKRYVSVPVGPGRYAPPKVSSIRRRSRMGNPDPKKICTSHIERKNLTIRTFQRRFTRLALGFSKKLENLQAAVALHFAYYNLCWIPRTIQCTPCMEAGLTTEPWSVERLFMELN